jgi:transposase
LNLSRNEEELRKKALELRRQGKSYREIAKEVGCSVFTVSSDVRKPILDFYGSNLLDVLNLC